MSGGAYRYCSICGKRVCTDPAACDALRSPHRRIARAEREATDRVEAAAREHSTMGLDGAAVAKAAARIVPGQAARSAEAQRRGRTGHRQQGAVRCSS